MAPPKRKRAAAAKFYRDDIVRRADNPDLYGAVARCWHDAEDIPPPADDPDPLNRPLKNGEVGVSWFETGTREILFESKLTLVDRLFQPGDFVKRSIDDVRSGVVTSIDVKGKLVHSISQEPVEGWKGLSDLGGETEVFMGDYVACDDWIGQIVEMFDEALVQVASGQLVRLPELSTRLAVGDKGDDILPAPGGLFSIFMPRPSPADTVVSISHTVIAIAWLAINQSLDPATSVNRPRPPRFFHGSDLSRLRFVRGRVEQMMRIGDRVQLKDPAGFPVTYHGKDGDPNGSVEVRTFTVKETVTTVRVIWQDGTQEDIRATELIPYLTIDEYDVWPGDPVLWKTEDGINPSIVQDVDAQARTAHVRVWDTGAIERVSLLELDAYGTGAAVGGGNTPSNFDSLGVRRGDFVFIHAEGTVNGAEKGRVPRIGEVPAWVREVVMEENGSIAGWRGEMNTLGIQLAQGRGGPPPKGEGEIRKTERGDTSFNWLGEVTDLRLDGTVEVTLADSSVEVFPLERLTKLYDGMDHLDESWDEEGSFAGSEFSEEEDVAMLEVIGGDDGWQIHGGEEGDWEDVEDEDGQYDSASEEAQDWAMNEELAEAPTQSPPTKDSGSATPQPPTLVVTEASSTPGEPSRSATTSALRTSGIETEELPWERFEILPSAPVDHAFYATNPSQPSKNFMSRLTKEYRALTSSLPDSVLVRAYEDRADLIRCMIIGSENTPYQDAPFVIDWMLNSDFPQSPPVAHFHSWTNGNGRVNPNLYEEGKVCLSILGTWSGDKNEIWSAGRSSLLQAFVSIQGLVLVKEPWFCEPAYEKLRGTEEGIVNSRLYSEKAYVLSRNFVRRALEGPVGGLETELNWLYREKGRLHKVIKDARGLIEKSRAVQGQDISEADAELAVPRLSEGGIIMLERVLNKLQAIADAPAPTPTPSDR